ncbi:MAG: hypothetical protein ACE5FU_11555 [Nitrospinota bacterium]
MKKLIEKAKELLENHKKKNEFHTYEIRYQGQGSGNPWFRYFLIGLKAPITPVQLHWFVTVWATRKDRNNKPKKNSVTCRPLSMEEIKLWDGLWREINASRYYRDIGVEFVDWNEI